MELASWLSALGITLDEVDLRGPVDIIVAHPDDETIGLGSRLPRLGEQGRFVYVTDGSPRNLRDAMLTGLDAREAYRDLRREELASALRLAGLSLAQTHWLGYPDQEASHELDAITRALARWMRVQRPAVVVTHPYEGGHPDHDATTFAVHMARRMLRQGGEPVPEILEMTSYHLGPFGIESGVFLPWPELEPLYISLDENERQLKRDMFECFLSQSETLRYFPLDHECLRVAPPYDFSHPPHAGRLFYDFYDWGMKSAFWCALARKAMESLGVLARR